MKTKLLRALCALALLAACKDRNSTTETRQFDSSHVAADKPDEAKTQMIEYIGFSTMSNPPDRTDPNKPTPAATAKTYLSGFASANGFMKFALTYTLDDAYMSSIADDQAVRIYNSFEADGKTGFLSLHKMGPNGGKLEIIPGEKMYSSIDFCTVSCEPGAKPSGAVENSNLLDLRMGERRYFRKSNPDLKPHYDEFGSLVITKEEYKLVVPGPNGADAAHTAVAMRIHHGLMPIPGSPAKRVLVITGVNAQGASIWDNNVYTLDDSHLCPQECDLF